MFNYLVNTFQGGLASSHMNYIFENESHEVSHTSSIVLIFDLVVFVLSRKSPKIAVYYPLNSFLNKCCQLVVAICIGDALWVNPFYCFWALARAINIFSAIFLKYIKHRFNICCSTRICVLGFFQQKFKFFYSLTYLWQLEYGWYKIQMSEI